MITKDELQNRVDAMLEMIRARSTSSLSLCFLPQVLAKKTSELTTQCIDLQKKILAASDDDNELLDLKKEVLDLDLWVRRRVAKNNLIPTIMILYVGIALTYWLVRFVDIPAFISTTLGVEAPTRLISLGIAGAFLYLATTILTSLQKNQLPDHQMAGVLNFTLRLFLAIIVPIVLVALFFNTDGTMDKPKFSPELVSFACGYSAKLVMDIFNKIVEKASKMIEAL